MLSVLLDFDLDFWDISFNQYAEDSLAIWKRWDVCIYYFTKCVKKKNKHVRVCYTSSC